VFSESVNFYYSSKYPLPGTPTDKTEFKLHLNKTTNTKTVQEFFVTFKNTQTYKYKMLSPFFFFFLQCTSSPYKSAECVFDADIGKTFHTSNLFPESHKNCKLSIYNGHILITVSKNIRIISLWL